MRLKPEIDNLRTFGTDGEINLYQAMNACFKQPNHLLCWILVKDSISKKLSKLKISNPLDAENEEEFEEKWKILADI